MDCTMLMPIDPLLSAAHDSRALPADRSLRADVLAGVR